MSCSYPQNLDVLKRKTPPHPPFTPWNPSNQFLLHCISPALAFKPSHGFCCDAAYLAFIGHPNTPWTLSRKHSRAERCITGDLYPTMYILDFDHKGNNFRKKLWIFQAHLGRAFFDSKVIKRYIKFSVNRSEEDVERHNETTLRLRLLYGALYWQAEFCACSWNVLTCWVKWRPNFWLVCRKGRPLGQTAGFLEGVSKARKSQRRRQRMEARGWQQRGVKTWNLPDDLAEAGLEVFEWDVAVKNASWYTGDMAPCKGEQPNSTRTSSVKISACFLSSKLQGSQTLFLVACKWLNHYQVLCWQDSYASILPLLREQSAFRSKSWFTLFLQQPWRRQSTPVTLTLLCWRYYFKFSLFLFTLSTKSCPWNTYSQTISWGNTRDSTVPPHQD